MIQKDVHRRLPLLDYARVIGAFLVVYGHLYQSSRDDNVRIFIYQFHLALFFFVSGMLHKYNGKVQLKKYFRSIIVPIFLYVVVYYLLTGAFYHLGFFGFKEAYPKSIMGSNIFITYFNYLVCAIPQMVNGTGFLCGPCWFLVALFYCKVFADLYFKRKVLVCFLWGILFIVLCSQAIRYLFVINAIIAMPYYIIGYYSKQEVIKFSQKRFCWLWAPIFFMIVVIMMIYNGRVSMFSICFGQFHNLVTNAISIVCFYISGFAGSLMVLSVSSIFGENRIINRSANALISILGFQFIFIFLIDNFIGYDLNYFISIIIALFVMVPCVILHEIIIRYCPKLLGR